MKEIVVFSDHPTERSLLTGLLEELFPECELRVLPRTSVVERTDLVCNAVSSDAKGK